MDWLIDHNQSNQTKRNRWIDKHLQMGVIDLPDDQGIELIMG